MTAGSLRARAQMGIDQLRHSVYTSIADLRSILAAANLTLSRPQDIADQLEAETNRVLGVNQVCVYV
jgi:hypothetical protein